MSPDPKKLKEQFIEYAKTVGFDHIGITKATLMPQAGAHLRAFLAAGWHGDMAWMEANSERRASPLHLWTEARSVIMVGVNYGPSHNPMETLKEKNRSTISVYAQGSDYHILIKKKLKTAARWLQQKSGAEVKIFVDTAPLMEKPLAEAAGLGWQGKHSNLVSRDFGSWLFLGAILTTADLPADKAEIDHCGSCQKCLDICPTNAFPAPYKLDARRCISYLTIEHKGHIPSPFRAPMGNRIFGCDDCLAVCPWNKYAKQSREAQFAAREESHALPLGSLLDLDDQQFRQRFSKSPIKRTGVDRFLRNVLIAAGNSGDLSLAPQILKKLKDPSPLVRAMAVWALAQLLELDEFQRLRETHHRNEKDRHVALEWQEGRET